MTSNTISLQTPIHPSLQKDSLIRRVLAIIVDFRSREDSERLSLEIAASQKSGFELKVLVVDNGNEIPLQLTESQKRAGVQLVRSGRNGGYSFGLNAGVRDGDPEQKFDAYWFLNSDLQCEPDCLALLAALLGERPKSGAVGPTILHGLTGKTWGVRGSVNPWTGLTAMTDWKNRGPLPRWSYLPGCSMLVRATSYRALGGMPERYRMYFEETEFCVRLQRAGWEVCVEPLARIHHLVDSLKAGVPSREFAFYFARNNLYFWRENFGIPAAIQFPRALFVALKEIVLPIRKANSLGVALERLKYVYAGVWDGWAFLRERKTPWEQRLFHE